MNGMELIKLADIHSQMNDPDVAHLVIGMNEVTSSRTVDGLKVGVEPDGDGVAIEVNVAEGARITKPVHMCFGLVQEEGIQKINLRFNGRAQSKIDIVAHCVFPNAADVQHLMDAELTLDDQAEYTYFERHIHSPSGGIHVVPKAKVHIGAHCRFKTDFELIEGRVGTMDIAYEATVGPHSVLEMNAKVSGKGDDAVKISEIGHLAGEYARGALTSRIAVRDSARAEVYNKLTASAAGARGHVDCKEIIQGGGVATAVPVVEVSHPKAHVTHEAALGAVDTKQLETLMARGLDEDAASDLIIAGMLS